MWSSVVFCGENNVLDVGTGDSRPSMATRSWLCGSSTVPSKRGSIYRSDSSAAVEDAQKLESMVLDVISLGDTVGLRKSSKSSDTVEKGDAIRDTD